MQYLQKNTCVGKHLQSWMFLLKEFFCEYCKILRTPILKNISEQLLLHSDRQIEEWYWGYKLWITGSNGLSQMNQTVSKNEIKELKYTIIGFNKFQSHYNSTTHFSKHLFFKPFMGLHTKLENFWQFLTVPLH